MVFLELEMIMMATYKTAILQIIYKNICKKLMNILLDGFMVKFSEEITV